MQNNKIEKKDLKSLIRDSSATTPVKTYAEADRKKGGRPTLSDEEKVSKIRLTIYLNPSEEEKIKAAAESLGIKLQAYVKMAAFAMINKAD